MLFTMNKNETINKMLERVFSSVSDLDAEKKSVASAKLFEIAKSLDDKKLDKRVSYAVRRTSSNALCIAVDNKRIIEIWGMSGSTHIYVSASCFDKNDKFVKALNESALTYHSNFTLQYKMKSTSHIDIADYVARLIADAEKKADADKKSA